MLQEGVAGGHIARFNMTKVLNNQVSKTYVHLGQLLAVDLAAMDDRDHEHRSQALGDRGTAEDLSPGEHHA